MARYFLSLFLLFLSFSVLSQSKMSRPLMDAINKAIESNSTVHALIMMEDRVDVLAMDRRLYEQKVSLQERAYTVITALQQKAAETQAPVLSYLASAPPGDVVSYESIWAVNMIVVEAAPSILMELSEWPEVGYLHINGESSNDQPLDPIPSESIPNGSEPGLRAVKADRMWAAGYTGAGSIVMNLDSGVNVNHPALSYKWRGNHVPASQAWFDPISGTTIPSDRDGSSNHGTHTMGIMTGLDPATSDTVGMAPGAEWIAANGASTTAHNIAGFQWAMDPDGNPATTDDMPTVINCSIYDPDITTQCNAALNPYIDALTALETAGVAVVWSAGNSGPGASTITPPKNVNLDEVHFWATGALDGNNPGYPIAGFSSRGPVVSECTTGIPSLDIKPEASAPGVSVRSSQFNSYGSLSGTSMAAPHVSGAIALLKEAHPNRTGHELKMALYLTAVDLGVPGEDNTYGMGIIDVWAAHESLADPNDPNPPRDVTAYSDYTTPTSMALNWTDPTTLVNGTPLLPSDFTIEINRDSLFVASVPGGAGNYNDSGLTDGTLYIYDVFAKLIANDSTSSPVTVSWHAGGSPVPAAPTNLAAAATTTDATLTWDDPTTQEDGAPLDDLDHINIYRDGALLGSVSPGTQTYTDTPLPGFFYNYTVTAVDNETPPNESLPGNTAGAWVGATPGFIVWVGPGAAGASAASGDSIFAALAANGESVFLTNNLFEFGNDLSIYEGVFVVLGIFSNNHVISASDPEGPALAAYLQGGGNIYLEGGDCFNYDPGVGGYNIRPWFDLNLGSDGSGDVSGVMGLNDLSAFSFPYNGENNYMDKLLPINSIPVWQNNANTDISGVFNTGFGSGKAIGVVPSFGGMADNTSPLYSGRRAAPPSLENDEAPATVVKVRGKREESRPFVKKAAYYPELKTGISRDHPLYKITPGGLKILANTKVDLMAAYLEFFFPQPLAQIVVNPPSFSDTLFAGQTGKDSMSVNMLNGALPEISFEITENPPVDWLNLSPTSDTLSGTQSSDIILDFDAANLPPGNYAAILEIASNDLVTPLLTVPVALEVLGVPVISASSDSVVFDTITVNQQISQTLYIFNRGSGDMAVADIISTHGAFTVDTTQFTVAPEDSMALSVTFAPVSVGLHSGWLQIINNDPNNDTLQIYVEGFANPVVGIGEDQHLPQTFAVSINYPNPFNPSTTIDYQLPQSADVTLEIYNVLGQKVRTLVNARMVAGRYQALWDARNDAGTPVGSGVYIYRFRAGDYKQIRKMVLLK